MRWGNGRQVSEAELFPSFEYGSFGVAVSLVVCSLLGRGDRFVGMDVVECDCSSVLFPVVSADEDLQPDVSVWEGG